MTIIRIKLFGSSREIAGGNAEITLKFTDGSTITITDLRKRMLETYPKLEQIPFVFAINYKIVSQSLANTTTAPSAATTTAITPQDEIALLPPVSGG